MDTEELEAQPVVQIIHKNELSRASFTDKTSQVYGGAVVATRNMKTNSVQRWKIEPSDQEGGKGTLTNDTWQGDVTAENETQAQAKAKGALKEKNKDKITGSITVVGERQAGGRGQYRVDGHRQVLRKMACGIVSP